MSKVYAHFSPGHVNQWIKGETSKDRAIRMRALREKLLPHFPGWGRTYFHFEISDLAAKAKAKAECDALCERVSAASGVPIKSYEGCFL